MFFLFHLNEYFSTFKVKARSRVQRTFRGPKKKKNPFHLYDRDFFKFHFLKILIFFFNQILFYFYSVFNVILPPTNWTIVKASKTLSFWFFEVTFHDYKCFYNRPYSARELQRAVGQVYAESWWLQSWNICYSRMVRLE